MDDNHESRTDRTLGTFWNFTWPLLFLCTMTVLSMVTQRYSGYVSLSPQATFAQTAQPSPSTAR